jgi:hypothetical protein
MRVKLFFLYYFLTSLLLLLASAHVKAQAWLADRTRAEGHGIRLGDFELHPGIGAEAGYDSNIFLAESGATKDGFLLRITPHLFLSTLGEERKGEKTSSPPAVTFRAGGSSSFYHYFYSDRLDNFAVGADMNLTINPDRPVSFQVNDNFTRSIRPFTEASSDGTKYDYARDQNVAGGKLQFASKSGLLKAGLGFDWGADLFEDRIFSNMNSFTYSPNASTSWQFLPMTAFLYDVRLDFQDYYNFKKAPPDTNSVSNNTPDENNNTRVASRIGINGEITPAISLTMLIGYAAGFYNEYDDFDDVIGQIEARWRASSSFTLKLGYDRTVVSALEGNFCRRDRGYVDGLLLVGGRFLLDLNVWVGGLQFGVPRRSDGSPYDESRNKPATRQDPRVSVSLSGEYRFVDWFAITASVSYLGDFSDYKSTFEGEDAPPPDPVRFNKFDGWLGVRAFY